MTLRAIILGLAGAIFIAAGGYFNDHVFRLNQVVGNHFPIIVFGPLLLAVILINPLLAALGRSLRFRPAELAVVVTLMFAGCTIPGSGMMRFFTRALGMPATFMPKEVGWKKTGVMDYLPPSMLPGGGQYNERVADGFYVGRGSPGQPISVDQVPWDLWQAPLLTWLPIIFLLGVASICLALIVHRQWAYHERLRYPVVDFTASILGEESSRGILRNRMFWLGLGIVLAIRIVNGIAVWYPNSVEIPLSFDLGPLGEQYSVLHKVPWSYVTLKPAIFPTAVAFVFFLASDIGLSLAISQVIFIAAAIICVQNNVSFNSDQLHGGSFDWQRFGSGLAFVLMLAYIGRRYYWQILRRALIGGKGGDQVYPYAVWACRILLLCVAGVVAILVRLGLDWTLALPVVALTLMIYLIISRMNAEGGLILAGVAWQPTGVILALLGIEALGPAGILILGMLALITTMGPHESLMPFLVNGFRLCDDMKVRPARIGWATAGALALAIAVAVPVALWADYNYGTVNGESWPTIGAPKMPFDAASQEIRKLSLSNLLEESKALSPVQRITHMSPNPAFLGWAGAGFAAVCLFSLLRLRASWWPLHPLIFIVMGTWATAQFAPSFLLGWMVKTAVAGLGGAPAYRTGKIFMIGVIAGDLLGGLIFMAIGAIYYAVTNTQPPLYRILPGG
ncbi:MAG: DUF6785 family protein [Phycisphaerae bacterium]|jgi:hypothetical protein